MIRIIQVLLLFVIRGEVMKVIEMVYKKNIMSNYSCILAIWLIALSNGIVFGDDFTQGLTGTGHWIGVVTNNGVQIPPPATLLDKSYGRTNFITVYDQKTSTLYLGLGAGTTRGGVKLPNLFQRKHGHKELLHNTPDLRNIFQQRPFDLSGGALVHGMGDGSLWSQHTKAQIVNNHHGRSGMHQQGFGGYFGASVYFAPNSFTPDNIADMMGQLSANFVGDRVQVPRGTTYDKIKPGPDAQRAIQIAIRERVMEPIQIHDFSLTKKAEPSRVFEPNRPLVTVKRPVPVRTFVPPELLFCAVPPEDKEVIAEGLDKFTGYVGSRITIDPGIKRATGYVVSLPGRSDELFHDITGVNPPHVIVYNYIGYLGEITNQFLYPPKRSPLEEYYY
jgi:hypothetical protein